MASRIICAVCGSHADRRRTCRRCGRPVCLNCIHGDPLGCLDCYARELEHAQCSRARCERPATMMTWGKVPIPPGGRSAVFPLCETHAEAASERYVLRFIHRPSLLED